MSKKVMLGMSGGVDSSAAALLLIEQGYSVCGATMLLTPDSSQDSVDCIDAAEVCKRLGIEHRIIDLRERFRQSVIEDFARQYRRGKTPNPCIVCNREIKFGAMYDIAMESGFDYIATGHYAKILTDEKGEPSVYRGDSGKDQSYVLWMLTSEKLRHILLPIGGYEKEDLRALAATAGLEISRKKDSQDICFIPDKDYKGFLYSNFTDFGRKGYFKDTKGNILGSHGGIENFTVGQRKGLGISLSRPMYVVRIENDDVVLGEEGSQYNRYILCSGINLISGGGDTEFSAQVKYRYASALANARVKITGDRAVVCFDERQRALTPGQSAVFYDGSKLLGGGIIEAAADSEDDLPIN
ncbi:MAG: tRNA 2-thiouridine(34) synthase MnmA [Ruminococcaceae bacterium]|nr:tRNA 2-thiouridine(34) synthase MnmA [Oscillospiraceae bacterium]